MNTPQRNKRTIRPPSTPIDLATLATEKLHLNSTTYQALAPSAPRKRARRESPLSSPIKTPREIKFNSPVKLTQKSKRISGTPSPKSIRKRKRRRVSEESIQFSSPCVRSAKRACLAMMKSDERVKEDGSRVEAESPDRKVGGVEGKE
ncbi:hypothetical protein K470DRAFT_272522 [Piedraia hortae CBS 480.64]|uniref:Uncharacterized protein n=1 Tax=Piedraia hortae CBS 480.64 TaxID=1314780 RepID=A0A6A7BSW3_9PEZI|nr:hypothetical protein K470DRAFT_272522 [Piedraia hortae CBS 480.64]